MEYSKLVAVTGLPGLYELINSKSEGAVVRSLEDNSTKFASTRIHNFSHLESIEVYTKGDNVNLVEIFTAMASSGVSLPDAKDNDAATKYFEKVYPDLDFDRVYPSDLKKMIKWFEVLKKNDIEIKLSEPEEEVEEEVEAEEEPAPPKTEEKPAKKEVKSAPKKEAKKKAEEKPAAKKAAKEKTETKPAKKSAEKKKEETKKEKSGTPKKKSAPKKK